MMLNSCRRWRWRRLSGHPVCSRACLYQPLLPGGSPGGCRRGRHGLPAGHRAGYRPAVAVDDQ